MSARDAISDWCGSGTQGRGEENLPAPRGCTRPGLYWRAALGRMPLSGLRGNRGRAEGSGTGSIGGVIYLAVWE